MDAASLTWSFIKRLALCTALSCLLHYISKTPITIKAVFYLFVLTFLYWFFDTLLVKISTAIQERDETIKQLNLILSQQQKKNVSSGRFQSIQPNVPNIPKAATGKTTKLNRQEIEDESTRYRY